MSIEQDRLVYKLFKWTSGKRKQERPWRSWNEEMPWKTQVLWLRMP